MLQPCIVAAILARTWHWSMAAAIAGVVAVFLVRRPLIVLALQRYVWKNPHSETLEAGRWVLGLGLCASIIAALLFTRWPFDLLVIMGFGAIAMTVLAVWATLRNRQRSVPLQIASAAGLTSSAIALVASACGSVPSWAWWLWGALVVQATAAILTVHARLDARIQSRKVRGVLPRPTAAFTAQAVLILIAIGLGTRREWWLAAAMAIPALLNCFELVRVSRGKTLDTPLSIVGFRAVGYLSL